MKQKIKLAAILVLSCSSLVYGQLSTYIYQRELTGIKESWHSISLPVDLLSKAKVDLTDLRIYGIKADGDTIEAPYILRMKTDMVINKQVAFNIINSSSTSSGHYYTFEVLEEVSLNTLDLIFEKQNFDWEVQLEGSQDQRNWFTLLDSYRIVSIQNSMTSFSFTTLSIPNSKYRFYRLFVPSGSDPKLSTASIKQKVMQEGDYHTLQFVNSSIRETPERNETVVDLTLETRVHLSQLLVKISDTFNYYRPIQIKALRDSFNTEKGWKYQYQTIGTGMLNSFKENEFALGNVAAKQLQVVIENQDNHPLQIEAISAKRNSYALTVRFTEDATYYLVYGKMSASKPRYDLARFEKNIPAKLMPLTFGAESSLMKEPKELDTLFENKLWLWGLILLLILILGWFSLQMIRNSDKS